MVDAPPKGPTRDVVARTRTDEKIGAFVLDFSDASLFAMGIANIIGLYFLMPVVKREMTGYLAKLRAGKIPRYH